MRTRNSYKGNALTLGFPKFCAIVEHVLQSGLSHAGSRTEIRAAASKASQTAYELKLSLSAGTGACTKGAKWPPRRFVP